MKHQSDEVMSTKWEQLPSSSLEPRWEQPPKLTEITLTRADAIAVEIWISATIKLGTLKFIDPWALELVRLNGSIYYEQLRRDAARHNHTVSRALKQEAPILASPSDSIASELGSSAAKWWQFGKRHRQATEIDQLETIRNTTTPPDIQFHFRSEHR